MIVFITGVTAGFGTKMAEQLVQAGHTVIGTGRRQERLDKLKQTLGERFLPLCFDVSDKQAMADALGGLNGANDNPTLDGIDVLINNAGLALGLSPAHKANLADWETMIDVNITGLIGLTHTLLPSLVKNRGLIINIGSIAGTYPYPGGNVYGATKAFVQQFSLNLRADLAGTGVRVSNVEPGLCAGTEFSQVRFYGDTQKAQSVYENVTALTADDVANVVSWLVAQPAHVNVNRVEIMPTAQSFAPLAVAKNNP